MMVLRVEQKVDTPATLIYKAPKLCQVGSIRALTAGADDVGEVEGDSYRCSSGAATPTERR